MVTGVQTCALLISSRRRHTRCHGDWSSDVCSSDRSEEHTSELQAEDGIRDAMVTGVQTCALPIDRKSTRLNSSHHGISYAVFCLKKKEHTSELAAPSELVWPRLLQHMPRVTQRRRRLSITPRSLSRSVSTCLAFFFFFLKSPPPTTTPPSPHHALFRS